MPAPLTRLRKGHLAATAVVTTVMALLLALGLDLQATHSGLAGLVLVLFAFNTAMLAGAAGVALTGVKDTPQLRPPAAPISDRCAVLWLICGEEPEPMAQRIAQFLAQLQETGQQAACQVFVLSDTTDPEAVTREKAALAHLQGQIIYRNRSHPKGRKPGNLRDWSEQHAQGFDTMLVLDADSSFTATELAYLRVRMATDPKLGLIQKAIRLRPGRTKFAQMQRLSARISGPVFARGLSRLSGDAGNYWGHNALLRVDAFRQVAHLPDLSGPPPFGGPVLSHDFIEAAFMRRAGWHIEIDPDDRGSFEDAPETITTHLRRDRRWAQGNLQHLRLIGAAGLHPSSRLHLLAGIQSYLSAPIWLLLVLLTGSGAVHATGWVVVPLLAVLALLLVPKLAGLHDRRGLRHRGWRARVIRRAVWAEIALTTLFAPISMIRRTGFICAIVLGRDNGWVPSGRKGVETHPHGLTETLAGAGMMLAVTMPQFLIISPRAALFSGILVLPVVLPLLAARPLYRWFDRHLPQNRIAAYYDASTSRFLAVGGSGAALAIHRPLWGAGVATRQQAASHVNDLIAQAAEQALGRAPEIVRDLGCGVGGTLFHLAARWPAAGFSGITISAEQAALGERHAHARGLSERCRFIRSDFCLPMTLPQAELVIAIESHVHAPAAADFLRAAQRHLRPGGVLVVVDDMLRDAEPAHSPNLERKQAQLVTAFQRGWRLGHVPARDGLAALAQELGYDPVYTKDLTPLLKLNRLRDHALRPVAPLLDKLGLAQKPFFGNMIGGNALTESYHAGIMRYTLMVLRRPEAMMQSRLQTQSAHESAGAIA